MTAIWELQAQVSRLVREARLGRDWTQAELARRSDVSLASIQKLERDGKSSLETFLRVLRALDRLDVIDSLDEGFSEPSPMEALRLMKKKPARPQRASRRPAK